jgi:hypothetical protein
MTTEEVKAKKQLRKAKVIMIPTSKNTKIVLNPTTNKVSIPKELIIGTDNLKRFVEVGFIPCHLYIILDNKIKENDYCIETNKKSPNYHTIFIAHNDEKKGYIHSVEACNNYDSIKKVIATTDISLTKTIENYPKKSQRTIINIPQLSQQFIEKYIECYNKDEVIIDVLVEYRKVLEADYYSIPKINPKDNTITIKKLKDRWNREEVKQLLINCGEEIFRKDGKLRIKDFADLVIWIENNI